MKTPSKEMKWGWLVIPASTLAISLGFIVGVVLHGPAWAAVGFGVTNWYLSLFTASILQVLES